MKEEKVNEIINKITEDSSLSIIREALSQFSDEIEPCSHDFDYVDLTQKPYSDDDGYYYLDMVCRSCGKRTRERYSFEGLECDLENES